MKSKGPDLPFTLNLTVQTSSPRTMPQPSTICVNSASIARKNRRSLTRAPARAVLMGHSPRSLSDTDYAYARCGREMWEKPSPLAGYFTTCGNIHDGTLAYRAAGLPLPSSASSPASSPPRQPGRCATKSATSTSFCACPSSSPRSRSEPASGGSPAASTATPADTSPSVSTALRHPSSPPPPSPNNEICAALGFFAAVYTAIGVAHALQGPRKKWRPRIILLTVILGVLAAAHVSAVILALLFTIAFIAYLAESSRAYLPTLLIVWVLGAILILFASYAFRPDAFSYVFRSQAAKVSFSLEPAHVLFTTLPTPESPLPPWQLSRFTPPCAAARYFGNTAPLIVTAILLLLITTAVPSQPRLWAVPFLLALPAESSPTSSKPATAAGSSGSRALCSSHRPPSAWPDYPCSSSRPTFDLPSHAVRDQDIRRIPVNGLTDP